MKYLNSRYRKEFPVFIIFIVLPLCQIFTFIIHIISPQQTVCVLVTFQRVGFFLKLFKKLKLFFKEKHECKDLPKQILCLLVSNPLAHLKSWCWRPWDLLFKKLPDSQECSEERELCKITHLVLLPDVQLAQEQDGGSSYLASYPYYAVCGPQSFLFVWLPQPAESALQGSLTLLGRE